MGTGPKSRKHRASAKKKTYRKACSTKRRAKDLDQIQDELAAKAAGLLKPQAIDDDLPGLGQHQCIPCSRFFISAAVLAKHIKTKPHKRRVKLCAEKPYSQAEADAAAGMGKTDRFT